MDLAQALLIALAGFGAGAINAVVGSGTLITFPTLLFFGYPPVMANVSNGVGLVAGGITGTLGYRTELTGLGRLVRALLPASLLGGVLGAVLLLVLPESAFEAIVPSLIALALVLVVLGPRLQRWAARHRDPLPEGEVPQGFGGLTRARILLVVGGVAFGGVYGGYFGAAQGVLIVGLMSTLLPHTLQQVNALKNLLVTGVNLVAALTFLVVSPEQIVWSVAGLIAVGALVGGYTGARVGRRLPPWALRSIIVVVGLVAIWTLVF